VALCGYLFLFAFPILALSMPVMLAYSIASASSPEQWLGVSVQVLLLLLGGVVSYAVFQIRLPPPSGLELTPETFPRLFELLQELDDEYGRARIDRVVLRDRFEVRVVKTPRNGFPLSCRHTLVIGLPVLLTMSPLEVHVLLARRVGQLAAQDNRVNSWLYFLRDMWPQYLTDCTPRRAGTLRPVCGFFRWYAGFYRALSVPLARNSELDADRYALRAMNDRDTARAITRQALTDSYLRRTFWPGVVQTAKQSVRSDALPHARMAKLFAEGLPDAQIRATLERIEKQGASARSAIPSLSERLDNIGHRKPLLPESVSVTAARFYLGGACDKCIEIVDRRALRKLRSRVIRECSAEAC
jgi:hypothetical protein